MKKYLAVLIMIMAMGSVGLGTTPVSHYQLYQDPNVIDFNTITPIYSQVISVKTPNGGDYNDIQSAINYAATLNPSADNVIKIDVYAGNYTPAKGIRMIPYCDLIGYTGNYADVNICPLAGIEMQSGAEQTFNTAALGVAQNCRVENVSIRGNYCYYGCGLSTSDPNYKFVTLRDNVFIKNCFIEGIWDGVYNYPTSYSAVLNWQFQSCRIASTFDAITINGRGIKFTDCIFDVNNVDSLGCGLGQHRTCCVISLGTLSYAGVCPPSYRDFVRCTFLSTNDCNTSSNDAYGVLSGDSVPLGKQFPRDNDRFIDCNFVVKNASDGNSSVISVGNNSKYIFYNCNFTILGGKVKRVFTISPGGSIIVDSSCTWDADYTGDNPTIADTNFVIGNLYDEKQLGSKASYTYLFSISGLTGGLKFEAKSAGFLGNKISLSQIVRSTITPTYQLYTSTNNLLDAVICRKTAPNNKKMVDIKSTFDSNSRISNLVNISVVGDGNTLAGAFSSHYLYGGLDHSNPAVFYSLTPGNLALPYATNRTGNGSSGLSFDGNDYVDTNNTYQYNNLTLNTWVKPADGRPASVQKIFSRTVNDGNHLEVTLSTAGLFEANCVINAVKKTTTVYKNGNAAVSALSDGTQSEWVMVTAVIQDCNFAGTGNMLIGSAYTGSIDDVRVYDTVLSQSEIRQLYGACQWLGEYGWLP